MCLQVTEGKAYATVFPELRSPPLPSLCPVRICPSKITRLLFKPLQKKYEFSDTITQLWIRYRLHFPPNPTAEGPFLKLENFTGRTQINKLILKAFKQNSFHLGKSIQINETGERRFIKYKNFQFLMGA